jgi:hypothetical protein
MKNKTELLKEQEQKKQEIFNGYVNKVNDSILRRFPNGFEIEKVPDDFRLSYYGDFNINWYTGFEEELKKITEATPAFILMTKELKNNNYEYLLDVHVSYSGSRPEWFVDLYIK